MTAPVDSRSRVRHRARSVGLALGPALLFLVGQIALRGVLGFNGLYGQDSYAYFDYAVGPLAGALREGAALPPFHWPPGYPLLVAMGALAFGPVPWVGQATSMLGGAAAVAGTSLLARELDPDGGFKLPLLAGLLGALTPQLWLSSQVVMSDTAGLAWAVLGYACLARYGRRPQAGGWLWLASALLAAAVLTRWHFAAIALPATGYALWVLARGPWRRAITHAVGAAAVVLVVLGPLLPTLLSAFLGRAQAQGYAVDLVVYRWSPWTAFRRRFDTADGLLSYRLPTGLYYLLAPGHRYYFTILLAPLLVPGFAWLKSRPHRVAWLLGGWAALSIGLLMGGSYQNFRFNLAHLPPLAIVAAGGAQAVWRRLSPRWRPFMGAYLLAGLLLMAANGWSLTSGLAARQAASVGVVHWADGRLPASGRLLTFQLTATYRHESGREVLELWEQTPASLSSLPAGQGELYLLLDLEHVAGQWTGLAPEQNLRWLEANRVLNQLGSRGGYTLFAVTSGAETGLEP